MSLCLSVTQGSWHPETELIPGHQALDGENSRGPRCPRCRQCTQSARPASMSHSVKLTFLTR